MAYRRSIIARTKLFYQQHQRFAPSFSHISSSDSEELPAKSIFRNSEICGHFLITRNNAGNSLLSGNVTRLMRSEFQTGYGIIFQRNMSKVPSDFEVLNDAGDFNGLIGVVGDKAVEAAPVVNEVAVAAADSYAPVAAFQYLIDYVHCYTGFEWWASIAAATLVISFIELPFLIHRLRFNSKNSATLRPQLRAGLQAFKNNDDDKGIEILCKLADKFGMIQFLGLIMSDVNKCLFFFAILNMAEKVPSFATGGTLWFMDLTTPDSISLPVLMALTLWIRRQLIDQLHLGIHAEGITPPKNANKFFAAVALLVAITARLPAAIYCYGIASNLFSIVYAVVMMDPQVQKLLGISKKPPSADEKSR
ncbi:mitochondrial inner membrane protein OXA1-like [Salvia miltiorrhiza]|uniref:mitochondrial inner membrane protein OXA1-like n=1 Tax=Salvia miltiorrhiza TaxID=226208 RepID=UPI0025AD5D83|nr:mitochondrial inner membrane protein OXA1-like [Salvia miltiorrhiza]